MAHPTEINVYLIAQTRVNRDETLRWLNRVGLTDEQADGVMHQVLPRSIVPGTNIELAGHDAEALVALAGKRCYQSWTPDGAINPNVTKIREDLSEYLGNILRSSHGSCLEHATFTFAVEGLTRVATPELNRHRAGVAISEGSLRYIRVQDLAYWLPTSVRTTDEEKAELKQLTSVEIGSALDSPDDVPMSARYTELGRKVGTERMLAEAFAAQERIYLDLCALWDIDNCSNFHQKKQLTSMFRRVVGMGMATGGIWTLNARALRHIIALRTSEGAEEEIRVIFDKIADLVAAEAPNLMADFTRDNNGVWTPKFPKV